jgi:hypothetical protein
VKTGHKVCIGVPNDGTLDTQLTNDLLNIAVHRRDRFDSFLSVLGTGLLTRSRNILIYTFLTKTTADWLLMMDSDEDLPLIIFDKLCNAAHEKERPVVSALVFAAFTDDDENLTPIPTVYRVDASGEMFAIHDYPKDTLLQVGATGTGALLIHRSVLIKFQENATENQGDEWCWFIDGPIKFNGVVRWFGEDLLFCRKLAVMKIPLFVHTGAILRHHKKFWLDERHHALFLAANPISSIVGVSPAADDAVASSD